MWLWRSEDQEGPDDHNDSDDPVYHEDEDEDEDEDETTQEKTGHFRWIVPAEISVLKDFTLYAKWDFMQCGNSCERSFSVSLTVDRMGSAIWVAGWKHFVLGLL